MTIHAHGKNARKLFKRDDEEEKEQLIAEGKPVSVEVMPKKWVVRCACFIPGGIQCILPMYHPPYNGEDALGGHKYYPEKPFSEYVE